MIKIKKTAGKKREKEYKKSEF
jgi:hypothetical protein